MKRKRVTACLVAGIFILAVSATAAFSSVNGYANYKYALKSLALDVDNATISGTYAMSYDGKTMLDGTVELAMDGRNHATHVTSNEGDVHYEHYETLLDGVNTWYNVSTEKDSPENEYYYEHVYDDYDEESGSGMLNLAADDEFSRRLVNFMEIGADTVVGDLKNNVIEIGSKDGVTTYQIDVSENQVPSLVNAGLSLMAYTVSEAARNVSYVEWEDYELSQFRYYEEKTGHALSEEFKTNYYGDKVNDDWWNENEEAIDEFLEVTGDIYDKYYEILEEKGERGVLYVHVDGSYDYYPDAKAFDQERGISNPADISNMIGQDLTLKNVHFTFGVNKDSQLVSNLCEAIFDTTDEDGNHHEMVIKGEAAFTDYGATVVKPLDVSGRVNVDDYDFSEVNAYGAEIVETPADETEVSEETAA